MRSRIGLLVLSLLGMPSGAWADSAPPAVLTVEQWIEQLGDRDFAARERAARAIEALGADALPALRKARTHTDQEIRKRAEHWIPQLERAVLVAPTRVSLHIQSKSVREAFAALAKSTGYKIDLMQDPARDRELRSFDFEKLTFWEAFDRLCDASGAGLQPNYGDDTLRLYYQDRFAPFVYRHGAFRVTGQSLDYGRSIQFGSLPRTPTGGDARSTEFLRFGLAISAEPRLPLLSAGEPSIVEAHDDLKQPMLPPMRPNGVLPRQVSHYYGGYRTNTMNAQVNLGTAARGAKQIKLLRGTIPLTLIAEQKDLVVTEEILKSKGKKTKVGSMTFEIQDVKEKPNKQYEVKMLIVNDAPAAGNDFSWYNSLYHRTQVRDEKGTRYNIVGSSMSINNNTSAQVTYTFNPNSAASGPPTRLIYQEWTTIQYDVPFEFRDMPLP